MFLYKAIILLISVYTTMCMTNKEARKKLEKCYD